MKFLLAIVLALVSGTATCAELDFSVIRGDAGAPPGLYEGLDDVVSRWTADGKLIIEAWAMESASDRTVDSSAVIHHVGNGEIRVSYAVFTRQTRPDEAIAGCDDFVMLRFELSGLDRANYEFVLERRTVINRASVLAN